VRPLRVIGGAAALVVAIYLFCLGVVIYYSHRDQRRPVDAIVVLGAAEYNGHPSPVLRARLDHALDLYHAHYAHRVIVTGGVGDGEHISEAQTAQRYLASAGIPADSVSMVAGRTTASSMDQVRDYAAAHAIRRVLLVSDPFHLARLHVEAWRLGLTAFTSPTETSPISRNFRLELGYLLAEAAKLPLTLTKGLLP
jgi:uncharacterized SAM-binding protein YcdF (DUF218 family)